MRETKQLTIMSILFSSIFLFSCEKVIDIELNEADSRLVIEGNISTEVGPYEVLLSTSGGYFDNTNVKPVENGFVRISDQEGNSEILEETAPGVYVTDNLTGVADRNYFLQVEVNGQIFSGSEYLPEKVEIDTLYYEIDDFGPPNQEGENYSVLCTFTDPVETLDYYRFIIYVNGQRIDGNFNPYTVTDDILFNGKTFTVPFRGTEAKPGDIVKVELRSIGFSTYEYFRTLNDAINDGGIGSTPYNPISNLNNGALGYFGAYSVSVEEVEIQ